MIWNKIRLAVCLVIVCAIAALATTAAFAQESQQTSSVAPRESDANFETQLYLILATNRDAPEGKMPVVLQPVLNRLHETLSFKHYSLAASFLNRVKHNGRLEMTWVGGPLLAPAASPMGNPSFNQFTAVVRMVSEENGRQLVRMEDFRFGSRVPIITAQINPSSASTNATSYPTINYESVGLRTAISMAEGVPVIAGTLIVGPSGDAIIVVISAKRVGN
ncbi:MAG TPA: hypothetical protein VJT71_03005 [Pyrinomonadaceae bacterium]|nr:hypothetical protein [Pyrinomonadaceae bacterium]